MQNFLLLLKKYFLFITDCFTTICVGFLERTAWDFRKREAPKKIQKCVNKEVLLWITKKYTLKQGYWNKVELRWK
jgi:hypothetical protein